MFTQKNRSINVYSLLIKRLVTEVAKQPKLDMTIDYPKMRLTRVLNRDGQTISVIGDYYLLNSFWSEKYDGSKETPLGKEMISSLARRAFLKIIIDSSLVMKPDVNLNMVIKGAYISASKTDAMICDVSRQFESQTFAMPFIGGYGGNQVRLSELLSKARELINKIRVAYSAREYTFTHAPILAGLSKVQHLITAKEQMALRQFFDLPLVKQFAQDPMLYKWYSSIKDISGDVARYTTTDEVVTALQKIDRVHWDEYKGDWISLDPALTYLSKVGFTKFYRVQALRLDGRVDHVQQDGIRETDLAYKGVHFLGRVDMGLLDYSHMITDNVTNEVSYVKGSRHMDLIASDINAAFSSVMSAIEKDGSILLGTKNALELYLNFKIKDAEAEGNSTEVDKMLFFLLCTYGTIVDYHNEYGTPLAFSLGKVILSKELGSQLKGSFELVYEGETALLKYMKTTDFSTVTMPQCTPYKIDLIADDNYRILRPLFMFDHVRVSISQEPLSRVVLSNTYKDDFVQLSRIAKLVVNASRIEKIGDSAPSSGKRDAISTTGFAKLKNVDALRHIVFKDPRFNMLAVRNRFDELQLKIMFLRWIGDMVDTGSYSELWLQEKVTNALFDTRFLTHPFIFSMLTPDAAEVNNTELRAIMEDLVALADLKLLLVTNTMLGTLNSSLEGHEIEEGEEEVGLTGNDDRLESESELMLAASTEQEAADMAEDEQKEKLFSTAMMIGAHPLKYNIPKLISVDVLITRYRRLGWL